MSRLYYDAIYNYGQVVYLVTDTEQRPKIVVKHILYPDSIVMYGLAGGTSYSEHYELEISENRNLIIVL